MLMTAAAAAAIGIGSQIPQPTDGRADGRIDPNSLMCSLRLPMPVPTNDKRAFETAA